MDLEKMNKEDLENLIKEANAKLEQKEEKIIYVTDFTRGNSGYKRWAKVITSIDNTKTNCYAFVGDWLSKENNTENILIKNSYIIEFIGRKENQFTIYKATDNNKKDLILEGDTNSLVSFILKAREIIK